LARASRSKRIQLPNYDHEILLAKTFTGFAIRRIDTALRELEEGEIENGDINLQLIAKAVLANGGYIARHPLAQD